MKAQRPLEVLASGGRLVIRDRIIVPEGKPKLLGPAARKGKRKPKLGYLVWEDTTGKAATIIVGLDRGKEPKNKRGQCRVKPVKFNATIADKVLERARAAQLGPDKAWGVTRMKGRGIYKGRAYEQTHTYQFFHDGTDGTFTAFKRNMKELAEALAEELCQDEVLVVFDDKRVRDYTCSYSWGTRGGSKTRNSKTCPR